MTHPDQVRINEWWLGQGLNDSAGIGISQTTNQGSRDMLSRDRASGQDSIATAKAELVADGLIDEAGRLTQKAREMGLRMPERPGRVNP